MDKIDKLIEKRCHSHGSLGKATISGLVRAILNKEVDPGMCRFSYSDYISSLMVEAQMIADEVD